MKIEKIKRDVVEMNIRDREGERTVRREHLRRDCDGVYKGGEREERWGRNIEMARTERVEWIKDDYCT